MTAEQLDHVADTSAANIKELIGENNNAILEAISHALESAEEEKHDTGVLPGCKISLTHKIEIDLVKLKQLDRLSWAVAHKSEIVGELPDPNQPLLGLGKGDE